MKANVRGLQVDEVLEKDIMPSGMTAVAKGIIKARVEKKCFQSQYVS